MSNRRRDRAVAEGRIRYSEQFTELEDITDWKNPAFRYVTVNLITDSCVTVL